MEKMDMGLKLVLTSLYQLYQTVSTLWVLEPNYSDTKSMCIQIVLEEQSDQGLFVYFL